MQTVTTVVQKFVRRSKGWLFSTMAGPPGAADSLSWRVKRPAVDDVAVAAPSSLPVNPAILVAHVQPSPTVQFFGAHTLPQPEVPPDFLTPRLPVNPAILVAHIQPGKFITFRLPVRQPDDPLPPSGRNNSSAAALFSPSVPAPRVGGFRPFLPRVPNLDTQHGMERLRRFTEILSALMNSLFGQGYIVQTGIEQYALVSGGFALARSPGAADDVRQSVQPGMVWVNTLTNQVYVNASNAVGAAVWIQIH